MSTVVDVKIKMLAIYKSMTKEHYYLCIYQLPKSDSRPPDCEGIKYSFESEGDHVKS